jgi:hypothetical protein
MIVPTLSQVAIQFSPIILMESFIPRIQDGMRRSGVVHYRNEENRWLFSSHDERELVIITASSFVFQVFGAGGGIEDRSEALFSCFCDGVEFSAGAVFLRVGIRRLFAMEGGGWRRMLKRSYHGVRSPLFVDDLLQYHSLFSQGVSDVGPYGLGNLSVKMLQNGRGLVYPLDVVCLSPEEERPGVFVTILDIEHVLLTDEVDSLSDMLTALKRGCDALLMEALSEEGAAQWQRS